MGQVKVMQVGCKYSVLLSLALLALASTEQGGARGLDPAAHVRAAMEAAHLYRMDPALLVAVAWEESRGQGDRVSPKGACGALQIKPQFVPGVSCDDLMRLDVAYTVGAWAITRWKEHCPAGDPLACYNGGNAPGRASMQYAQRVRKQARWLAGWMERAEEVCR